VCTHAVSRFQSSLQRTWALQGRNVKKTRRSVQQIRLLAAATVLWFISFRSLTGSTGIRSRPREMKPHSKSPCWIAPSQNWWDPGTASYSSRGLQQRWTLVYITAESRDC